MKILFLAQRVPYPPNKGDKLRSFNEIKYLSRNHQISLVCLTDSEAELQHRQQLMDYCESVDIVFNPPIKARLNSLLALFSSRPLTLAHFHSAVLQKIVTAKLQNEQFDLIFVYCSSMAQYVKDVRGVPRVIDYVDVDSEKWYQYSLYARFPMSAVYRIESRRMKVCEREIAAAFQHGFLVSDKEADDFRRLVSPTALLTPIPNGVDLEAFQPSTEPYEQYSIVFTGAMDYFANVDAVTWFIIEILPLIRRKIQHVKLYVVGSNPTDELKALADKHPNVIITGFVDRVQPSVQRSAVCVAPMRIARGVQNKILEAMAMGVPVVTTSLGFEGIMAKSGSDIVVANEPERFAEQVVRIMQISDIRAELSRRGRQVVEMHYRWETNLGKLEDKLVAIYAATETATENIHDSFL